LERSLSVLLPVHNHESVLATKVQRILDVLPDLCRQFELVIIDDGSTDATIELADELASKYPQVHAIRHEVPLGRLAALRSGLNRSQGEVILLYDEDAGLSMKEIQQRWKAINQVGTGTKRNASVKGFRQSSPLWSESSGEEGYQMVDRRAMKMILEQADTSAETHLTAGAPSSRPRRPNYMSRLREFALGE
jgi:glycosyltransferase involved in cell wall biosynthesis